MGKWEFLIATRERLHLSQQEASERLQVGLVTYQRWETGKAKPQPHHMRHLHEVFGMTPDHVKMALLHEEVSDPSLAALATRDSTHTTSLVGAEEELDEPRAFIATNMTAHLWSLVFIEHPTCSDKRNGIRQAIEEFDIMNSTNKNYQITRREALCSLATLPMITLGLTMPGSSVRPAQYGAALAHCAASVEACWELRKSSDANDRLLTFQCATKYVSILETIAHNSSQYRKDALDLATRYAVIKAFLGRHAVGLTEAIQYAKDAIALSKENGDISLQLSAYGALAWSYFYDKKYALAEKTAQEAEMLLQQYTRLLSVPPLHPCIQGKTYSILALTQAKNGKSPEAALGKAMETDTGNESYAFMDFRHSNLLLETGWTYCHQGNQVKAMEALEQRVDLKTLASKIPQSEMGRLETINVMILSSIKAKSRDIEQTVHLWTAGIKEAIALKSEQRFNEVVTTYDLMEVVWPDEQSIKDLRDLIDYW